MIDPFRSEHPGGYLADSQFDYPGRDGGWRYYALDAQNAFARFEPAAASADSATPLAFLVCDDPHARVGRDVVHAGYQRRPCLQWHAPSAGAYRLEGEVGLLRSDAAGQVTVRVFVDDDEVLTTTLDYPQMLTFEVEARIAAGGFVRVLFGCKARIDGNDALQYLRIRACEDTLVDGERRVRSRCEEPPAWQRLRACMALDGATVDAVTDSPLGGAALAHRLYGGGAAADPALLAEVQARARADGAAHALGHRRPRFFRVHPVPSPATDAAPRPAWAPAMAATAGGAAA